MRYAIGIDLGGTKTAAGIVTEDGRVLCESQLPTPARDGADAVLDSAAVLVHRLLRRAEGAGIHPDVIGIGSAGVIDRARGTVISATDALSGWAGTRLSEELESRTGLLCTAINDVHAHALGESWAGAAKNASTALLVAIGTGVGGSYVVEGAPLQGAHSVAGHVGHLASPLAYDDGVGRPCSCGGAGHVEAVASGPAIHAAYSRDFAGAPPALDAREVYARALAGDVTAHRAVSIGAAAAGQAIGGLVNVLDPDVVVVGGGMAGAGPLWWNTMVEATAVELLQPLKSTPIVPAALGGTAAVLGAARLALTSEATRVAS